MVLTGACLRLPHGVAFLDDLHLAVANRAGSVVVLPLPAQLPTGGGNCAIAPLRELAAPTDRGHAVPGSLRVSGQDAADAALWVCHNQSNRLLRHALQTTDGLPVAQGTVALQEGLDLPDGMAFSRDQRWLAVSNHCGSVVYTYRRPLADAQASPDGVLRGVRFPHGLAYSADGRHLLVADSGAPFVHVYTGTDGAWEGVRYPAARVRVMADAQFEAGHLHVEEGGLKGLDLSPDGRVLVVTAALMPLLAFDVVRLLANLPASAPPAALDVGYELHVLREQERRRLRTLVESRSWRLAAPLRWLAARLRLR